MPSLHRLTATLVTAALGWTALTMVVAAPSAYANAPHDPATYYAGTEGLSGTALALKLNEIIDGNTAIPYTSGSTDVWDALDVLDRDPNDPTKVIDVYSGDSLVLTNKCGSSCALDGWNREHTWAQSRGSFDTDPGPGTDLFHMHVSRGNTNSSRGNKDYDNGGPANVAGCPVVCHADGDSFEPRNAIKGDIARGLFYMDVRYNGDADDGYGLDLRLWDTVGDSGSQIGKLSTLVAWSLADPPDDGERTRNNLIDSDYQHNRNPFIDHPEWVCSIWGSSIPAGTCNVPVNQPPTTAPMTKTTAEDTPTTVALTGSDPDGDPITWSITTTPTHGLASITGGSTLNYSPAANYHGGDVVGVTLSDGKGGTTPTTVTITVTPVNDAPAATAQSVTTEEDTAKVVTLAGTDADGDTLTYGINQPGYGTVTLAENQATYTPAANYHGPDSFTFTVNDSTAPASGATVSLTVTSVNDAPVATPQSVSTNEDTAKVITLAGTDVDADTLSFAIVGPPAHGTVSRVGDQATYTPAADFHGDDVFTFEANDGTVASPVAEVEVTVASVNDAPQATPQSVTTPEDTAKVITLAGTDDDVLTYDIATPPAHGTVTLADGDQATYTPAADYHGPDSFTFKANDGSVTSSAATVSITVTSVNDAPAATAQIVTTDEDTAKVIALAGTDTDGDTLSFAIASQPAHGAVILAGGQATYTPAADYHGPDSFTFTVNDGTVTSPAAAVGITVSSVNDAPAVSGAQLSTVAGAPVSTTLQVSDADADPVAITSVTAPGHGSVTFVGTTVTYTPTFQSGNDSFRVIVSDGHGGTASAQVDVVVTPRAAQLAFSGKPRRGHPAKLRVSVNAVGVFVATGQVTLKVGRKTLTAQLVNGVATFRVKHLPASRKLKVMASYAGDSHYAATTGKHSYPIRP